MKTSFFLAAAIVASPAIGAPEDSRDGRAIKAILDQACVDMTNNKISGTTSYFQPDILIYDFVPPLVSSLEDVQHGNVLLNEALDGPAFCKYEDVTVRMLGTDHAFSGSIIHVAGKLKAGGSFDLRTRSTDVWERTKTGWRAIHEHTSVPTDPIGGKAFLLLPLNKPGQ